MRIVQKYDEPGKPQLAIDLPAGTVFKLKGLTTTYLRAAKGYVDLTSNVYYADEFFARGYEVDIVYPNARVVLE